MKIAIIGAGNMGGAIARGLLSQTNHAVEIAISNPSTPKLESIQKEYPKAKCYTSNQEAIDKAQLVILAVKPWLIEKVLCELSFHSKPIIASVAAGISFEQLASWSSASSSLYRIIPNTAISIRESMTIISSYQNKPEEDRLLLSLFDELGTTLLLPEDKMAAATSVASCGIAFFFKHIQASMQAGIELGLTPKEAMQLASQAAIGAGLLLNDSDKHPSTEIDKVTTPGGKTIKGINQLDQKGFTNALIQAIKASI